jgi:anthranilate synthase component I
VPSNVSGLLSPRCTPLDAFRSVFPAGTVSGAPKVRAIELVATVEAERRHIYAGAVGYWAYGGALDTAIAIRTITVCQGVAYLQAGAGIVFDSVPAAEYDETLAKMRGVMRAIDAACAAAGVGV